MFFRIQQATAPGPRWQHAVLALILAAAACGQEAATDQPGTAGPGGAPTSTSAPAQTGGIDEREAADLAWQALEPNTASGARANWEIVEVKRAAGREVAAEFEGEPAPGCWQGPTPVPNGQVDPGGEYWFVLLKPGPATALPPQRTRSPTEPPDVPEPFMFQARFLIDAAGGRVVARKLNCVIY